MASKENILTRLSSALSNLHMAGYREGYNAKTIEFAKVNKESNNSKLRMLATNTYLEALKLEKTYKNTRESIISEIKEILLETVED